MSFSTAVRKGLTFVTRGRRTVAQYNCSLQSPRTCTRLLQVRSSINWTRKPGQAYASATEAVSSQNRCASRVASRMSEDKWSLEQGQLSQSALALQRDFRSGLQDPVLVLQTRIANDTADLETVRLCLVEQSNRVHKYPRVRRREILKDLTVGSSALQWLWKQDERWTTAFIRSKYQLGGVLTYFLAGEGRDDFVLALLKLHLPAQIAAQIPERDHYRWRGILFRSILEAHLILDHDHSADSALDLFFQVRNEIETSKRNDNMRDPKFPISRTSTWPGAVALCSLLGTGAFYRTSSRKFDRFLEHLEAYRLKRAPTIDVAYLRLVHPSRPSADSLIRMLEKDDCGSPPIRVKDRMEQIPKFKKNLGHATIRARTLLQKQGRSEDARWLDEYMNAVVGKEYVNHLEETTLSMPAIKDLRARPNSPSKHPAV